jgi:hypothetical protein
MENKLEQSHSEAHEGVRGLPDAQPCESARKRATGVAEMV